MALQAYYSPKFKFILALFVITFCTSCFFYIFTKTSCRNSSYPKPITLDYWPSIEPWSDTIKKEDMDYIILEKSNCTHERKVGARPLVLATVFSHPSSWERRKIIRKTWGSPDALDDYQKLFGIQLVFFFILGSTPDNPKLMDENFREHVQFRDIIQGRCEDVYRKLTHKQLFALRFASEYCGQAEYYVMIHDDVFVNGYSLFRHIADFHGMRSRIPRMTAFCKVDRGMPVTRRLESKHYVTREQYSADIVPDYCAGMAWIMTIDMVKFLAKKMPTTKVLHYEDVYISLALFNETDKMFFPINHLIHFESEPISSDFRVYKNMIFVHLTGRSIFLTYDWWAEVLRGRGILTEEAVKRLNLA